MMDFELKQVPQNALKLSIGEVSLKDNGENARTAPFQMVARTGKPIEHWFWGKLVHDLSGMKLHKNRIPIDWCHTDTQLGYANRFNTESGDLVVNGVIQSFDGQDKAAEVIWRSKNGHPYEASIAHDGEDMLLEEIPEGYSTTVNGYEIIGPAIVVKQWNLRSIAVCPEGADKNTSTELSADTKQFNVKVFKNMETKFEAAVEAEVKETKVEAVKEEVKEEVKAELTQEVDVEADNKVEQVETTVETAVVPVELTQAVDVETVGEVETVEPIKEEPIQLAEKVDVVPSDGFKVELKELETSKQTIVELKAEIEQLKNRLAQVAMTGEKPVSFQPDVEANVTNKKAIELSQKHGEVIASLAEAIRNTKIKK